MLIEVRVHLAHNDRHEIFAGSVVDEGGQVQFPILNNAFFLKPFAGMPFEQFVVRVRSVPSPAPNTATVPHSSPPSLPAIPLLAGFIALMATALRLPSTSAVIAQ